MLSVFQDTDFLAKSEYLIRAVFDPYVKRFDGKVTFFSPNSKQCHTTTWENEQCCCHGKELWLFLEEQKF